MNPNVPREMRVTACLRLDGDGAGFALPLCVDLGRGNHWIIQEVDEVSGLVAGFKPLESETATPILLPASVVSRIGGPLIHAFIADDGVTHAGTLGELEPVLRGFLSRCPERLGIRLQIVELIGTLDEKRTARTALRQAISESTGAIAAHAFFEGSVLRMALWSRLIANATSDQAARRILQARKRVDAKIGAAGEIKLDLSALDPNDYARISSATLIKELEDEFGQALSPAPSQLPLDVSFEQIVPESQSSDRLDTRVVDVTLRHIRNSPRQEERLSILLDAILKDPNVGIRVLESYSRDRAKYANKVIRDLATTLERQQLAFGSNGKSTWTRAAGIELVRIADRAFARSMPTSRAALFFYMAKHLAKYPEINRFLRKKMARSYSIFLFPYRKQIVAYLDAPLEQLR